MTTSVSTRAAGTLNPTRQQLDELDALLQRMLELPVNKLDEEEQAETEEAADEPVPPLEPTPAPAIVAVKEMPPAAAPVSYMVVETASPRPLPPASGFEPRPSMLKPQLVPVTPAKTVEEKLQAIDTAPSNDTPIPTSSSPAVPPSDGEAWVPLRSTWKPSPQTWPPLADSWHQAKVGSPTLDMPQALPSNPFDLTPAPAPVPLSSLPDPQPSEETEEQVMPLPAVEPRLSLSAEDAPRAVPWTLQPLLWFNRGFDACMAPLGAPGRWLRGPGRQALGFIGLACLTAAVIIAATAGLGWSWWSSLIE
ncbi:MAG: hypothetical protein ACYC3I_04065 [Gemmataceae bacterium]